ncbi:MAG: hypothetical protein JWP68_1677, partial [Modestobacter sp.]|nr:hypothetical protein [Modestobacter sp.]
GGAVYWSSATGAHPLNADMQTGWARLGRETGVLGYPTTDITCGLTAGGCAQWYQGGTQYWSPATGTHFVRGVIRNTWAAAGWEGGYLGYPTTDELCGLRNGGCHTQFQGGSIYWSPSTGAQAVAGAIRDAWAAQGWESGSWGYPTGYAQQSGSTVTQRFQGGTATWNTTTGTVTFG